MMMLSSIKKKVRDALRSYLTKFNVASIIVYKSNSLVIMMAAVSGVAGKKI